MGVVAVFTCIGSAAAPFVLELKRIHETLPFGIMGGVAFIAAILASALPETKGKPTAEVLEDRDNGMQRRIRILIREYEHNHTRSTKTTYLTLFLSSTSPLCIYIYIYIR